MSDIKYKEGLDLVISGINKTVDAVKITYGPYGKTAFIKDRGRLINTKDGVTVAKNITLEDPFENIGSMLVKEVAEKSNMSVGDGTTTSCILIQSLVNEIAKNKHEIDNLDMLNMLDYLEAESLKLLNESSIPISIKNIRDVAMISSNNDKRIADILYNIYSLKGEYVDIRLEKMDEKGLHVEYSNGYTIDRGYASPLFINNPTKEECFMSNVDVIIYPKEVNSMREIVNLLSSYTNPSTPLLFMCNYMNPQTIADISKNNMEQRLECLVVQTPINNNEEDIKDLLCVIDGEKEDGYYVGHIDAVSSKCQNTTLVKHIINNNNRVRELNESLKNKDLSKYDKDKIKSRINRLNGGSAKIFIGGNSNVEQKELEDRVEDAVKSCQAAFRKGVAAGAGYRLATIAKYIEKYNRTNNKNIFTKCFYDPVFKIIEYNHTFINDVKYRLEKYDGSKFSLSMKLLKDEDGNLKLFFGDCIELGIIDPVEVIENEIKNSISVARSVLTNGVVINNG